jgi:acyl-CoA thioester hydrolase
MTFGPNPGKGTDMADSKKLSAEIEFTVEFYDVDSMRIVWHGNYVKYFEKARCALLNKIGYNYLHMEESGYQFPVTGVSLKYIGSFRFGDRVRALAVLEEYENCIKIRYELYDAASGELRTKGNSTQMAINAVTGESCFVCPPVFINRVETLLRGSRLLSE